MDIILNILRESWLVLGEMAPYLWLGFLVAGLLSVWISPVWLERHLGGGGLGPVFKASLFGVPLPLCSCGVIPVAASLRQHGASRAATTAFLLSTPQTGVDSILVTHAMLGPLFAIYRPVVALLTGLVGGGLVQLLDPWRRTTLAQDLPQNSTCSDGCCSVTENASTWRRALQYGLLTLPRDIGLPLLLGVLIAGALSALVQPDSLAAYLGGGVLSILLLMLAGVPLYVCATASVPIAAGFIHMGASPGAALAFLIAGPATNAATVTTVMKVMGGRTAAIYLATVALSAFGSGLLLNWLAPVAQNVLPELSVTVHTHIETNLLFHLVAITLLVLLVYSYLSERWQGRASLLTAGEDAHAAPQAYQLDLTVDGMNCSHCRDSVKRALSSCVGVQSVEVSLAKGRALVRGRDLSPEALLTAVASLGFEARLREPIAPDPR